MNSDEETRRKAGRHVAGGGYVSEASYAAPYSVKLALSVSCMTL